MHWKNRVKKAGLDPVLKPRERHFLWFTYQLTRVSSRFSETLGLTNKIREATEEGMPTSNSDFYMLTHTYNACPQRGVCNESKENIMKLIR